MVAAHEERDLDTLILQTRRGGENFASLGSPLNKLQEPFLTETGILRRLAPGVVMVMNPRVQGYSQRVCFVLDRPGWRTVVELLPENYAARINRGQIVARIFGGGDVQSTVWFRGKDLMPTPEDCQGLNDCAFLLCRLEHQFFSAHGFMQAEARANPSIRRCELDRNGMSFVPAPWTTGEGEEAVKWMHVYRRRSWIRKVRLFAVPPPV
jgi:hypothetical protein